MESESSSSNENANANGQDEDGYSYVPSSQLSGREVGPKHVLFVVDQSGSMRKNDVKGYRSRTHAVYNCIERDFAKLQQMNFKVYENASNTMKINTKIQLSIIEFSDEATIVKQRATLDNGLIKFLQERKHKCAQGHGNYIPALQS